MNADGTGTMTLSSLALDVTTRQVAKNDDGTTPDPIVLNIPVNAAGEFRVDFNRAIIPGDANPITGAEVDLDMFGASRILSQDLYCGMAIEGSKTYAPLVTSLVGSVFAARRIAPGTIGAALPTPSTDCTVAAPVDAGVPDAGSPDATGLPDAGLPDAGLPDAAPMIDGSPR
jgi:hypothetical protein